MTKKLTLKCLPIRLLVMLIGCTCPTFFLFGQTPIEIERNSTVLQPHFQITEIGQDYTRMTFKNTANPDKFWTIAAETHNTGTPRINFYYDNGPSAADRFTVTGAGRVGINTTSPSSNLHVVGDVRISDLAGTGTKPVYAQSNGKLVARSATQYYSIPASAFRPGGNLPSTVGWVSNGSNAYFVNPTGRSMIAPVNLPHGSTIKKITVVYEDHDPSYQALFQLEYYDSERLTVFPWTIIGYKSRVVNIVSSGGSGYNVGEEDNLNIVVDNSTRSYSFRMVRDFGVAGRQLDSDFKIIQVIIEYVY